MNDLALALQALPVDSPIDPVAAWASAPDAQLVDAVASALETPRASLQPSSFVLHAPLELLARAALLPFVSLEARAGARHRIAQIAARYAREGEPAPEAPATPGAGQASVALALALEQGQPEAAVAALDGVLAERGALEARRLVFDLTLDRLGAAAHTPILLAELPRVVDRVHHVGRLLRAPLRTLASAPAARLSWHLALDHEPSLGEDQACALLRQRLASPARATAEASSIASTMQAVERSGQARALLGDLVASLSPRAAERELLRLAAWSMLQDSADEAPYGWTHCLTLPLGVLGNVDVSARPRHCVAVAATYVLGMRATRGAARLDPARVPPATAIRSLAGAAPPVAAAVAWHTPLVERSALVTTLASRAAVHHDAHVAKYTLACLGATERDPAAAPLYLSAAAYLQAWWDARDRGASAEAAVT